LQSVPDRVAHSMANCFYKATATLRVGEALAAARKELMNYPPACWGAFALFGDPNLQLSGASGVMTQTRSLTLGWDSLIGRHLAVRTTESQQRMIDAVAKAQAQRGDGMLERVARWLELSFSGEEPGLVQARLELCRGVAEKDAVAGLELRM